MGVLEMTQITRRDHSDAVRLAQEAGDLLLRIRAGIGTDYSAGDAMGLGDQRSNELLIDRIRELHPGDAVLSEESPDSPLRAEAQRVWIIDPLDGTREFGEPPRNDWAVHVALAVAGTPVAGAVALPGRGLVLGTMKPPVTTPVLGIRPRIVVSRTRPPTCAARVADALGATLERMGSAGAKAMAVVLGEADIYLHSGGQYEWDSAAPVAVASSVGLHASRLDGSPLRYNQPSPWLPDLLICRPELVRRVLEALGP
jgi:3'(2'), 5'-bisphosphate nucleotidase